MSHDPARHPPMQPAAHAASPQGVCRGARPRVVPPLVLAAAAAVLAACGGGGGGETVPDNPGADGGNSVRLAASARGELTAHLQGVLRERETRRQGGGASGAILPLPVAGTAPAAAAATPRSDTLLQEPGVDEADLLKTDGTDLWSLRRAGSGLELQVHRRAASGAIAWRGTLALPAEPDGWRHPDGLMPAPAGDALALIDRQVQPASRGDAGFAPCPPNPAGICLGGYYKEQVGVQRIALAAGVPSAGTRVHIDGTLVGSRRIGNRLFVVTSHRPLLPVDALPASATPAERQAAIAALTPADYLPRIAVDGGAPVPLVDETDCFVQRGNAATSVELTTITVFDLANPSLPRDSRCIAGGSEALYLTPTSLYLATTRYAYGSEGGIWAFPTAMRTDIHKFVLAAGASGVVDYRGSADVEGHLGWDPQRRSLRLSEHAGVLRVLTYTGRLGWGPAPSTTTAPSPAKLTLLREAAPGGALEVVATLPNARRPATLGKPGEQVYGVRFVGERGYLVTFRQIDPLYVLDLADPADPRIAGELELPGFSDHLVPLPNGLLLGVGRDVDPATNRIGGVKVSLLDVGNPAAPREIAQRVFGGAGSQSALDSSRHGLNLLVRNDGRVRIALPLAVGDWSTGFTVGLQRLEVDSSGKALAVPSMLGAYTPSLSAGHDVANQRSLQIGEQVYYLREGQLGGFTW